MDIEKERCQFCGRQAKHFLFAAFVCDSEDCIEKARIERGGPGGHMKRKKDSRIELEGVDKE
ncbi:MAG: hypothetical protein QHH00_03565 [Methanomassiliicoccales archaeon]|jgi:hypothetical protein|nr:hypothetical protein [Methanomassiliicoccales archaeon]